MVVWFHTIGIAKPICVISNLRISNHTKTDLIFFPLQEWLSGSLACVYLQVHGNECSWFTAVGYLNTNNGIICSWVLFNPFYSCLPSSVSSVASLWKLCSQQKYLWITVNHLMKWANICIKFHNYTKHLNIHSVQFSSVALLLLLLSRFSFVWLCATP